MASEDEDLESIIMAGIGAPKGEDRFRTTPITAQERMIVNNLFDTQPTKRKAYLKQIGFEMNPKDDNQIRPLGSNIKWDDAAEIDPGLLSGNYKLYQKGGLGAVWREANQDVSDIAWDSTVQAGLVGSSAAAGATAGSAVPVAGTVLGGILGGFVGNAASEGLKNTAGDLILEGHIPQDMTLTAIQSLATGIAPSLVKGATGKVQGAWANSLAKRKDAIIEAAKRSGGGLTKEIVEEAAAKPELYSEEVTKEANRRMDGLYKEIFGTTTLNPQSTRQIKDGAVAKVMKPLNDAADNEISRLSGIKEANFSVGELLQGVDKQIEELTGAIKRPGMKEALAVLKEKRGELLERVSPNAIKDQAYKGEVDFKTGRDFLASIQDHANQKVQGVPVPESKYLQQVAGGQEGGLRQLADLKAQKVYEVSPSPLGKGLPEINKERSNLLTVYQKAQELLSPTQLEQMYVGRDNMKKGWARDILGELDRTIGTDYADKIEETSRQRIVDQIYSNPVGFGSGMLGSNVAAAKAEAFNKGLTRGGAVGTTIGGAIGGAVGGAPGAAIGGTLGGGLGGLTGANIYAASAGREAARLSSPERALRELAKATDEETNSYLGKILGGAADSQVLPAEVGVAAGNQVNQLLEAPPADDDEDLEAIIMRGVK